MEEKGEFEARPVAKPAESVALPRAKASPVTKILCFVFALIAVGLGAFIVYDKVFKPVEEKNSDPAKSAKEVKTDDPVAINKKVRKIVEDVRVELIKTAAGEPFELEKRYDDYVTYEYESGYSTNLEATFGLMFAMESSEKHFALADAGTLKTKINAVLEKYGLKRSNFEDLTQVGESEYYVSDDGYICVYSAKSLPLYLDCGHNSWLSEEKKTFVKTLAEAYKASGKATSSGVYTDAVAENIETTKDGKYQRITASLGDAAGLFYRETDGEWKFLTATQQATDCSWFDTDELKAAFAGVTCYEYGEDAAKETTVK